MNPIPSETPIRTLVADDEPTTRILLERLLTKWGYDVIVASDGAQAWAALSDNNPPRLAILDWHMPGFDGLSLCKKLRGRKDVPYVYTIVITQRVAPGEQARTLTTALDAGADEFLLKPLEPLEIRSRLGAASRLIRYEDKLDRQSRSLEAYAAEMEQLAQSRARQLARADRMATLGLLAAGIAHEVNNPATFIAGNVQTLKRFWQDAEPLLKTANHGQTHDPKLAFALEETPRALESIHNGVRRITKIVAGLKSYARQRQAAKAICDVNACIGRALDLCRYQLTKRQVEIEQNLADDLPSIHADAQQLEQVFVNLFLNAADAMEGVREPVLAISSRIDDEMLGVCIEDSGPGIKATALKKIWEPFFTTKATGKGTGLGLAISRGIVTEHGGHLHASNRSGGGARFAVQLPISQESTA